MCTAAADDKGEDGNNVGECGNGEAGDNKEVTGLWGMCCNLLLVPAAEKACAAAVSPRHAYFRDDAESGGVGEMDEDAG